METEVVKSFISPDNTWALWTFLTCWAAISIYLEQKYKWASAVSGSIIALVGAIVLANIGIIPTTSPVYDTVWDYVVPIAIPLLLFNANIVKIYKESGRAFLLFNISSVGTALGVIVATFAMHTLIPEAHKVAAMITGSYIGGGVNLVAMSASFVAKESTINALVVADNINMAIYLMILMAIPSMAFFKKYFNHPIEDRLTKEKELGGSNNNAATYWGRKEISLLDIAMAVGTAFLITALSTLFANYINSANLPQIVKIFLGQKYLIITTLTMIIATAFPNIIGNIRGAQEIGTFLIYLFFVVLGVPANLKDIIVNSPSLLLYCLIVVIINMAITFAVGKLFKANIEELCVVSSANIGGPTTAAAMAIAKGWTELVVPVMLVGVWGYIVGNVWGVTIGNWFANLF